MYTYSMQISTEIQYRITFSEQRQHDEIVKFGANILYGGAVAAPEGRSRVGFSHCEAAERRRREERGAEGSRRRRRRDERRRREGRGAIGAEGGMVWGGGIDFGAFCH